MSRSEARRLRALECEASSKPPVSFRRQQSQHVGDCQNLCHWLQALDGGAMNVIGERRAAILDHGATKLANVCVTHSGCNAAVGYDAGEIEVLHAAFAQHPLQPRHVKGRVGDLLYGDVGGRKFVHELLTPCARREVALLQEWPQGFQMRRDDGFARTTGHQREQRCRDQYAILTRRADQRCKPVRQRRDGGAGLSGAAVGAVAMQEIVLQIAENKCAGRDVHQAGSTIRLPSLSIRPTRPGSITVVASGCSRIAGPTILASTGSSSRAHTVVSRHPPSNQTGRDPSRAVSTAADGSGANTAKSNAGRRPIAATRNDTIRIAMPGSRRLNEARYAP